MSYILDALRRADSERERGAVPGLHAQQDSLEPADAPAPAGNKLLLVAVVALSAALLLVLGWSWLAPAAPAEPVAQVVQVVPAPPPVAPPAVEVEPARGRQLLDLSKLPPPAPAPMAAPPSPVKAAAPASVPGEPNRVFALNELPDHVRRELPNLVVGGASYSENPSSRMLIINGQVFHERDKVTPRLTLEQISLKAAVLEYKGYRYRIAY